MEIDESIVLLGEELDAWWEEFSPMLDSEDRGAQAETLLRGFEIAKRFDSFKTQGLAAVKALLDRQDTTEHAGLASQIQAFAFAAKLANTLHDQFRDIDGETQVARLTEAIVKALERTATGRAALAERGDVLDAAGGTDIFQMPAGRVKITTGVDTVRCLRLSDKAKILRWYADCAGRRSPTPPPARASRWLPSFTMSAMAGAAARCSARRSAAFVNTPPPDRCRRMRRRCHRSAFSSAARQSFSAGGGAGSVSQIRSLTISRARRSPCRACSHRVSAPPFNGVASEKGLPTFLSARKAPTAGVLDCTDSLD